MSSRNKVFRHVAVTLLVAVALPVVGCGKYGKPVRKPPEPREQAERRVESHENLGRNADLELATAAMERGTT